MRDPLDELPRAGIGHWPTPLERCDRLRDALGGPRRCPEFWVKREDASGLGLGGNKVRKLDYIMGEALAHGAGAVITVGAVQSNHARQTAAACARLGLHCDLVLFPVVDRDDDVYRHNGNVLLDRLFGATVHVLAPMQRSDELIAGLVARHEAEGRAVWDVPAGGTDVTGTLAYVAATAEWAHQSRTLGVTFDRVVTATSTGGTYAGTLLGVAREGLDTRLTGICVHADARSSAAGLPEIASTAAGRLGIAAPADDRWDLVDEFLGPGYGVATAEVVEAVALFARTEALLLDPVYTGKAASGLVAMIRRGELTPDQRVLFLHTGGAPSLFAYGDDALPTV